MLIRPQKEIIRNDRADMYFNSDLLTTIVLSYEPVGIASDAEMKYCIYAFFNGTSGGRTYLAAYIYCSRAKHELKKFKEALFRGAEEFQFIEDIDRDIDKKTLNQIREENDIEPIKSHSDTEQIPTIEEQLERAEQIGRKDARQELQEMQERLQKRCREIKDMERTARKIKKIFCCILIFVIYGVVIHIGAGLIKNPVILAAVSIVVGAIGAAIAGVAKENGSGKTI